MHALPRSPHFLRILLAGAFVLLTGVALLAMLRPGLSGGITAFHGTAYEPPEPAPEFALVDHTGRLTALSDYRGRAVLLFFGFVNCPDVCPLTLTRLSRAVESLGPRAGEIQIVLVTVDPERDTPEALAAYVERFGPGVIGLTGEPKMLEEMRAAYGVYAVRDEHPGEHHPQVVHSSVVFGINRTGQLRVLIRAEGPEEELRSDLRTLLAAR